MRTHKIYTSKFIDQDANKPTPSLATSLIALEKGMSSVLFATSVGGCVPKQKENTMDNMEQQQRSKMQNRLYFILEEKDMKLCREFGLVDDDCPKDAEEIVQRIKDGKFVLREKNSNCFGRGYDRIRWRDPAKVEDRDGYDQAYKRLRAAFETVNDKAYFLPIADAYVAFEEFKKEDFRTAA